MEAKPEWFNVNEVAECSDVCIWSISFISLMWFSSLTVESLGLSLLSNHESEMSRLVETERMRMVYCMYFRPLWSFNVLCLCMFVCTNPRLASNFMFRSVCYSGKQ